jgi:hypothetical protein
MAAKNTIPMLVDLYRNKMTTSKCYGMIFGRVFSRDGLNLKGFAKHLSHHGKLATYEMMVLVPGAYEDLAAGPDQRAGSGAGGGRRAVKNPSPDPSEGGES